MVVDFSDVKLTDSVFLGGLERGVREEERKEQ